MLTAAAWWALTWPLGGRRCAAAELAAAPPPITWPTADPHAPFTARADHGLRWREGAYDVWVLRGHCELEQGAVRGVAGQAVLWVDRAEPYSGRPTRVIAYLEGEATVDFARGGGPHAATGKAAQTVAAPWWLGRFATEAEAAVHAAVLAGEPTVKPAVYRRAMAAREARPPVRLAQYAAESPPAAPPSGASRRLTIRGRSSARPQAQVITEPERNETIVLVTGGVNVVVHGVGGDALGRLGVVDIETDRLVIWTAGLDALDFSSEAFQRGDTPLEFYMEGNIVFRQGDRVIYAERMYYNVTDQYGVVLQAEMLTPVPDYEGLLRLKAEVLQQLDRQHFQAFGAAATSSRLAVPRYWFQSESVTFQDNQRPRFDPFTGQPLVDPETGRAEVKHALLAVSRNNFLYLGGVPVFYWPVLATDLTKPTYYLDRVKVKTDSIFGLQTLLDWDLHQLLGLQNAPAGTTWSLSTDYLSERGFALGTAYRYERDSLFGWSAPARGFLDAWGLIDHGEDDLGFGRRAVPLEQEFRGRVLWRHRQRLANDVQVTGELGLISDRNFLEQYFEQEWDEQKDQITGLHLQQIRQNRVWSVEADVRLNDFFTQTDWLPRGDHFVLGQSLLWDRLTWHAHTHAGYARLRTADPPTNPVDGARFDPLAWEAEREGLRAATRQELDLPLELGPVNVTPYVLGEAAYWGETLDGGDLSRLYGQVGVRARLPMARFDPTAASLLWNIQGLAHKVTFEGELFWADANRDMTRFPLYDPLDDDATEHFRRRMLFDTYGLTFGDDAPLKYDERLFALRSGLQRWVAAPSTEIADDLTVLRLAVRQRWQTKRGAPGRQRIIDWITFDVQGSLFPKPGRDNFGADVGLLDYDFRWHVGDRFTLLSDGFFDVFADGLRMVTFGGRMSRPEVGDLYLGFASLEGPISSNILSASVSYRMSEKWVLTASASMDFGEAGNIGQTLAFTRIGESTLVRVGLNVDESRDNVGAQLAIEPRFMPTGRLSRVGGVTIPPAGAYGLE